MEATLYEFHHNKSGLSSNSGELFIDWMSLWQVHPNHTPINSGSIITSDGSGRTLFAHTRTSRIQGSHSTSCSVKSDGSIVVASGNFGRLNRQDNLFNFSPLQFIECSNRALEFASLPRFSFRNYRDKAIGMSSPRSVGFNRTDFDETRASSEFLHLSRIDLTKNYSCGSVGIARSVIRAISGKSITRVKKGVGGDVSVWWSNTRYMLKVYIKSLEMESHGCTSGLAYEYARDNGIIRLELELKRRELSDLGWSNFEEFLNAWDMGTVHKLFSDYEKVLNVNSVSNDSEFIDSLPVRLRVPAAAFLSGRDVRSLMTKPTFYRYRKALLDYGIDISDERPAQIQTKIRTVEIQPLAAPDWYWKQA
jgi:hypothetical protein